MSNIDNEESGWVDSFRRDMKEHLDCVTSAMVLLRAAVIEAINSRTTAAARDIDRSLNMAITAAYGVAGELSAARSCAIQEDGRVNGKSRHDDDGEVTDSPKTALGF